MNKIVFSKRNILYTIVSLFTFLVVLFSVITSELSVIGSILAIILGLFLTQWYLFVGLIKPRESEELNYFTKYDDGRLLPTWQVAVVSSIVTLFVIITGFAVDNEFNFNGVIVVILYIMGPVVFMVFKKWYMFVLTVLWIWFGIEWDVISDAVDIPLGLPAHALIGLFAMLWPSIMYGRHTPWFDWDLNKDDLKQANTATLAVSVFTIPVGILLLFLKINFNEFSDRTFGESIALIFLTIAGIYVVQGIMEETLFRDIIMKHWFYKIRDLRDDVENPRDIGVYSIIFSGFVIISIPFWGPVLRGIASILPFLSGVANRVGNLDRPLGEKQGIAIPLFEGMPLWPFYFMVGLSLTIIGIIVYKKLDDPMIAALVASGMIFGFAHFEDWRYVLFASVAGFGYAYSYFKTKNLAASALVHMGVDAVWSLILSY